MELKIVPYTKRMDSINSYVLIVRTAICVSPTYIHDPNKPKEKTLFRKRLKFLDVFKQDLINWRKENDFCRWPSTRPEISTRVKFDELFEDWPSAEVPGKWGDYHRHHQAEFNGKFKYISHSAWWRDELGADRRVKFVGNRISIVPTTRVAKEENHYHLTIFTVQGKTFRLKFRPDEIDSLKKKIEFLEAFRLKYNNRPKKSGCAFGAKVDADNILNIQDAIGFTDAFPLGTVMADKFNTRWQYKYYHVRWISECGTEYKVEPQFTEEDIWANQLTSRLLE